MRSNRAFNKTQQQRKASRKTGGSKFPPWEMSTLTFDPGETFHARFKSPGEGEGAYQRYFHWPQGGFPHECTLEHPSFGERCVGCVTFPEKTDRGKRTLRTAVEVIDFRYFHIVPHPEKENKDTITRCVHSDPNPKRNRCNTCADKDPEQAKRHGPRRKVVELTQGQFDQVWAAHLKLEAQCIQVDGEGNVCDAENYPVAFLCEHCEDVLMDEKEIQEMPWKQLAQFTGNVQTCEGCSQEDFPWGIYACANEGRSMTPGEEAKYQSLSDEDKADFLPEDASHWVLQGSMFDKTLEVTVAGEEKLIGDKMVVLKNFNFGTSADWASIEDDLAPYDLSDDEVEELISPLDLRERYRPERSVKRSDYPDDDRGEAAWVDDVLAKQADGLRVDNPFGKSNGGGNPWGGNGGGGSKRSFKR